MRKNELHGAVPDRTPARYASFDIATGGPNIAMYEMLVGGASTKLRRLLCLETSGGQCWLWGCSKLWLAGVHAAIPKELLKLTMLQ